jgi:hypothetical protein
MSLRSSGLRAEAAELKNFPRFHLDSVGGTAISEDFHPIFRTSTRGCAIGGEITDHQGTAPA